MKASKLIKHSLRSLINHPAAIIEKNRNIKFHFNSFHGYGTLDKAIDLLNDEDREDFRKFTEKNVSYNMGNMFICNSKTKLKDYYEDLFPWLERCEKLFGFENLQGYGLTRMYTFLAERFMSYWFRKNTKSTLMPIIFYDIRKDIK